MSRKKKIEILDFNFTEDDTTASPDCINALFYIEYVLHCCYELNIPEICISRNSHMYQSLYFSRQKNKKYVDKIFELRTNELVSSRWRYKSILCLRSSHYIPNNEFKNYFQFDKMYRTKPLTQQKVDFYLRKLINKNCDLFRSYSIILNQNIEDSIKEGNYLNLNELFYTSFGTKMSNDIMSEYLEDIPTNKVINVVITKGKVDKYFPSTNFILSILFYINFRQLDRSKQIDFITNSKYLKEEGIHYFQNDRYVYFIESISINKSTANKFFSILLNDRSDNTNIENSLSYTVFKKLKQINNGTEVL